MAKLSRQNLELPPRDAWGYRIGTGAASINLVLMDVEGPLSIEQIKDQVRERGLPKRGAVDKHLYSLIKKGVITQTLQGYVKVEGRQEPRFSEESDIEGIKTEVVRLTSKRSRRLRDLALKAANGVCRVCRQDFAKVLAGLGVRVLQVHHKEQLSMRDAPSVTKVSDLEVVCANCHLLLHLDPAKALTVEQLRKMLHNE